MKTFRLEIQNFVQENRHQVFLEKIKLFGVKKIWVNDVYTIDKNFDKNQQKKIANFLTNPIFEKPKINDNFAPKSFDFVIEIGFLPGVTDNLGTTVIETIEDGLKIKFINNENVYSSFVMYFSGVKNYETAEKIAKNFANPLIQKIRIKSFDEFKKTKGMEIFVPKVNLEKTSQTLEIDLNSMSDEELLDLGKKGIKDENGNFRGTLSLNLKYLKKIREYFKQENRNPTDIELESIAQTWSEHCRHTIFANTIDEIKDGIFKHFIKRATDIIREKKGKNDFCVSVFGDNSGGIEFDENWIISDKMETHNSPSALDPLGGAMTGIVGVNRDALGFGLGARPVINRYGFCTADPQKTFDIFRGKNKKNPILQPKTILNGVVEGVEQGGNQSGIPTPQGFLYFHDRFAGKPLVFAGTIGLIPRIIKPQFSRENKKKNHFSWEKSAKIGDAIIMIGGKIGVDGIHGATFSSETLNEESPATAVQIGDPITQKKLVDAIVYELRDEGFINSIHDCGAGGISGTVGELGMEAGGFKVNLEKAPLKYPNMSPWEIWISESQERMCLSVDKNRAKEFCQKLAKRGVEATILGEFTNTGRGQIYFKEEKIFDLNLEFLEKGWPREKQISRKPVLEKQKKTKEIREKSISKNLIKILSRPNIRSQKWVSSQYDHIVQGGTIIGPLQGTGKVNGTASVMNPVLGSQKAVVISQALNPLWSEIDPYQMSLASIDDAIASSVAVGGNIAKMAIMDNFCWCSSDEPERLWQLKESAKGCFDLAVKYGTPFISGKDSMFNDFKGFDKNNKEVKISVPPTLLISTISVIKNSRNVQTIDFKLADDLVFLMGETDGNLGGSEFAEMGEIIDNLPILTDKKLGENLKTYQQIYQSHQTNLFASIQHIGFGGLAVAVAKSCLAGNLGAEINSDLNTKKWFSEDKSRFLVSINPKNEKNFREKFPQAKFLGKVSSRQNLEIEKEKISLKEMQKSYFGI